MALRAQAGLWPLHPCSSPHPTALPAQKAFGEGGLGNLGLLTPLPTGRRVLRASASSLPARRLCAGSLQLHPCWKPRQGMLLLPQSGGEPTCHKAPLYPHRLLLRAAARSAPGALSGVFPWNALDKDSAWSSSGTFSWAKLRPLMTSSFSKKPPRRPPTSDQCPHPPTTLDPRATPEPWSLHLL